MGNLLSLLSEPVVSKSTSYCQNSLFRVGSSCMQGWRETMEDAHTHILSLPDDLEAAFFAVYDGHTGFPDSDSGGLVAKYAAEHLHKYVTKQQLYKEGNVVEGLKQAFLDIDNAITNDKSLRPKSVGSTAVVVIVKGNKLFCANAGDSRAVASIRGRAEPLSFDHKPSNKIEYDRIIAAGGFVNDDRVKGDLNMSRALGDSEYKSNKEKPPQEQLITAYPDVEVRNITQDWEFVVLACDGIWDAMSNQEVVDYIRKKLATGIAPEKICETLMMDCLAPPDIREGSKGIDNMTVIIICLLLGGTFEDFSAKCAAPPVKNDEDSNKHNADNTKIISD